MNANDWHQLCAHLCPNDASLAHDVELARANPQAYFERFEQTLYERGIEEAAAVRPWLALVDGLMARGWLCELDWKLEAAELAGQLERLAASKASQVQLGALRQSPAVGEALLEVAGHELAAHELGLLVFDIDSDSYPMMPVPNGRLACTLELMARLGERAMTFP